MVNELQLKSEKEKKDLHNIEWSQMSLLRGHPRQLRGNGLLQQHGFGNRPQLQFGHRSLVNNQGWLATGARLA